MRSERADLLVVGGGPAGLAAATTAASRGLRVILVDEGIQLGGHLRQRPDGERAIERLVSAAVQAGVQLISGLSVWGLFPGWEAYLNPTDPARVGEVPARVTALAVVVATGTSQRPVPFAGWTLPGIVSAAAAWQMVHTWRFKPANRAVVAGNDPELVRQLGQLGVDVLPCQLPLNPYRPTGIDPGAGPVLAEAIGTTNLTAARLDKAGGGELTWPCELIITCGGEMPLVDLLVAAGCPVEPGLSGHIPSHHADMSTPLAGLFVAGNVAGAADSTDAESQGYIAGTAAVNYNGLPGSSPSR